MAEYSIAGAQTADAECSQESIDTKVRELIAYKSNKKRAVIHLETLATARFPDGGESPV